MTPDRTLLRPRGHRRCWGWMLEIVHWKTALAAAACCVTGCSALVLASGTAEEDIVTYGSTKESIAAKLGSPLHIEDLSPPIRVWDVRDRSPPLYLLVSFSRVTGVDGKERPAPPGDEATTKAYYRFVGRLKRRHDVGDALSADLMTLGMADVLMTPGAVAERSEEREHLLIAWLDRSGKVIAYEWGRIQQLP
jgi:hypothetical protein